MPIESRYVDKIKEHYGNRLKGLQLIHDSVEDTRFYVIYTVDGKIEIVRLFPSYFSDAIELIADKTLGNVDHTVIPLSELMLIVETVVNTLKGVD